MKHDSYSFNDFPQYLKDKILEKKEYERRLSSLLEDIRSAALGIDYQTKTSLKLLEKKVLDKLRETEAEIKTIVLGFNRSNKNETQGKLF